MSLTLQRFDLYELRVVTFWLQKSSIAELPMDLTWKIYTFSGSFAPLRMTARFKTEKLMLSRRRQVMLG